MEKTIMKNFLSEALLSGVVLLVSCGALPEAWAQQKPAENGGAQEQAASKCPPATRKDNIVEQIHGVSVADPYRWLEDQDSTETRAWIDAQDHCTAAALNVVPGRAQIEKRLTELMKVDTYNLPQENAGAYFFSKRRADQDLFVTYMRQGPNGADKVLIDPHPMSADHSTSASLWDVSRDGMLAAYGIRTGGQDEVAVHFLDTKTGKDLADQLPRGVYFSVVIEPSKQGVYYALQAAQGTRIFHHVMGLTASTDEEVFGKGYGRDKILATQLSRDGRDLLIEVIYGSGSTRADLYFKDLQNGGAVRPIVNDLDSVSFGEVQDGQVYVWSNWKAPHWRVFRADLNHPTRENWKEIIPESDAAIDGDGVSLAGGKIIVRYVRNAVSELKIFEADGTQAGEVPLPSLGAVSGVSSQWDSKELFFSFESFNAPASLYRYDLSTKVAGIWAAPKVPMEEKAYSVEQVWYTSKDGTRIPMFLLFKKGLARTGENPTWLTGYGGFDVNNIPYFDETALAWVDRGGIYAVANLRGGGEFGEAWHHAGMMENKQNVFDDFIAAAEWLIANKYTNSQKLAIEGASNGGLLVGAALTQRPELYRAVVCRYPLLDMVRYHKFMEGPFWVPEYGSAEDAKQFAYLYAYSPYHQVKDGVKYPAVLFVTGDGDTRVAPLHARKMTARLQAAAAPGREILLLYDTKSGHSGGRPLNKLIEEHTDILSFLFSQLGVNTE